MDVKSINPIALPAKGSANRSSDTPTREPAGSTAAPELRRELVGPLAQKILEDNGVKAEDMARFRVQLDIDDDTGRVVAEIRNKETGEVVNEVPSRKVLRQAAMLKEAVGMILDKPV